MSIRLTEWRTCYPDNQRFSNTCLDRGYAVQDIRGEGDEGSPCALRAEGPAARLQDQVAALVIGRVGQLQAQRNLAEFDVMASKIDMPIIMTAFGAVIDGVLE